MSALVNPFRRRVEPATGDDVDDPDREHTYDEIGAALGISGEMARLIAVVAMKKIRRRMRELGEP
jgi:DNA-directed RNA polymerase sigma subunit (sigma70/sigma32)